MITLAIERQIPPKAGWAKDQACRVLAGRYQSVGPPSRSVYVPEQIGVIDGWSFKQWENGEPVSVTLYVRVEE